MKTPISYYGGKQYMVQHLLPLIPVHNLYVEPFCGGAALFWAKHPSKNEALNDVDNLLINFYLQLKTNYEALNEHIQNTLHSETLYKDAKEAINSINPIARAWAYWALTQMSFANKFNAGFAFGADNRHAGNTNAKRVRIDKGCYHQRLKDVLIFNRSAIDVIQRMDTPETFFYLDPPYFSSDCGAYNHTKDVYHQLLELLPTIKGKFLLSTYPEPELIGLTDAYLWNRQDINQALRVSNKTDKETKTEVLIYNYQVKKQLSLFG